MASTYSTNLALELPGTGDQAGTWGNTTNLNLGTLIEQAISGYTTQAVSTGTDTTITIPNGATGVARNMYIELTGTGGASTNLIVPANKKLYFVFNNTSSGQVTVKVSGQTGVSVPNKAKVILVSNGTDIIDATNYIGSAVIGNLTATSGTVTTLVSSSATLTNLTSTSGTVTTLVSSSATLTNLTSTSGTISTLASSSASITTASGTTLTYSSGTVTNLTSSSATLTNLTSTSGTITTLSGSSASITNISGTSLTVSTATLSSNLTLNGGTANGVLYLNGSKVATSGSALVFDGTNLGIGTASPVSKVHSTGPITQQGGISTGAANATILANNSGQAQLWATGANASTRGTFNFVTARSDLSSSIEVLKCDTSGNLEASGNLGLGVTPSAWGVGKGFEIGAVGNGLWAGVGFTDTMQNVAYTSGAYKYVATGTAARFEIEGNAFKWFNAPSGTAGNTITFTQAMTLDASGRLLVGTTTARGVSTSGSAIFEIEAVNTTGASIVNNNNTSGSSAQLMLGKSRGSSVGGTTIVQNGDELGEIRFAGADGVDLESYAASIRTEVDGTPGANDMPGRLIFSTTADGSASSTEKARITASGAFLVGTTSEDGSASNTAIVAGGRFRTVRGTVATTTGVAANTFSLPTSGLSVFFVTAAVNASNIIYSATYVVSTDDTSTNATLIYKGSAITISLSGANVQVTQTSGSSQTVTYSAIRIL